MRNPILPLIAALLAASLVPTLAQAEPSGFYQVIGVEKDDMLKMRAGPGTGYRVVVGLPNGTVVWVQSCERAGNTSWCKVALKEARGLKGYVSGAYLQPE